MIEVAFVKLLERHTEHVKYKRMPDSVWGGHNISDRFLVQTLSLS